MKYVSIDHAFTMSRFDGTSVWGGLDGFYVLIIEIKIHVDINVIMHADITHGVGVCPGYLVHLLTLSEMSPFVKWPLISVLAYSNYLYICDVKRRFVINERDKKLLGDSINGTLGPFILVCSRVGYELSMDREIKLV